jgi:UDP-2-acetamido-3-amino-2,3-dideoxy-glucuronate N-acetyltransferase
MITIHPSADVAESAVLGDGVRVWQQVQIRDNARVGANCNIGKGVYIGLDVVVGANCKIHNYSLLHEGAIVDDGVFVGPHVVFANDMYPRAINPDGTLKGVEDWHMATTRVEFGAAIGTRSVLLPGITVGKFALVGAASVVTKDVPPYGLVRGHPARVVGYVCACARPSVDARTLASGETVYVCPKCVDVALALSK